MQRHKRRKRSSRNGWNLCLIHTLSISIFSRRPQTTRHARPLQCADTSLKCAMFPVRNEKIFNVLLTEKRQHLIMYSLFLLLSLSRLFCPLFSPLCLLRFLCSLTLFPLSLFLFLPSSNPLSVHAYFLFSSSIFSFTTHTNTNCTVFIFLTTVFTNNTYVPYPNGGWWMIRRVFLHDSHGIS